MLFVGLQFFQKREKDTTPNKTKRHLNNNSKTSPKSEKFGFAPKIFS